MACHHCVHFFFVLRLSTDIFQWPINHRLVQTFGSCFGGWVSGLKKHELQGTMRYRCLVLVDTQDTGNWTAISTCLREFVYVCLVTPEFSGCATCTVLHELRTFSLLGRDVQSWIQLSTRGNPQVSFWTSQFRRPKTSPPELQELQELQSGIASTETRRYSQLFGARKSFCCGEWWSLQADWASKFWDNTIQHLKIRVILIWQCVKTLYPWWTSK